MNNFSIIKSHLEYGHKVEVDCYQLKIKFIGIANIDDKEVLITEEGEKFYQDSSLWNKKFYSITPIPHRYKKLKVGMKVDVLREAQQYRPMFADPILDKTKTGIINSYWRYDEGEDYVTITQENKDSISGKYYISVPLWAITPHVEEEGITQKITRSCFGGICQCSECKKPKEIEPLDTFHPEIEIGSPVGLKMIGEKLNELVEHINLQSTNNLRDMKTPEEIYKEFCDEFEDYPSKRMLAALVISELEGQQKSLSEIEFLEFKQLDQRINEWKKLL